MARGSRIVHGATWVTLNRASPKSTEHNTRQQEIEMSFSLVCGVYICMYEA